MGWGSGSALMSDIIASLLEKIPDEKQRQEIYEELIPAFEAHDCDTLQECVDEDIAFHKALYEVDSGYRDYVDDEEAGYDGDILELEDEGDDD